MVISKIRLDAGEMVCTISLIILNYVMTIFLRLIVKLEFF